MGGDGPNRFPRQESGRTSSNERQSPQADDACACGRSKNVCGGSRRYGNPGQCGGATLHASNTFCSSSASSMRQSRPFSPPRRTAASPWRPGHPREDPPDLHDPASTGLIVRRWARSDLNAASAWCQALPESDIKSEVMGQVALAALAADPKTAVEWAQSLPAGASQDSVLETLGWETAAGDPEGFTLGLAVTLPDGDARTRLIQHSAAEWAQSDPASAVAWAKQIEDPGLRGQVLEAIVTAWSGSDPRAAAGLIASDIPPGAVQTQAAAEVVQRWAQQDPQAAAGWVGSFPPGALAETATANLIAQWAQSDREAAWRWLADVQDAGMRDAGFTALARSSALTDAAFAARCYAQVSDLSPRF